MSNTSKTIFFAFVLVVLSGCTNTIKLTEQFNAEQAKRKLKPGANTVSGSALIRKNGGGVVTCAGLPVYLIPSGEYADARISAIYGNTKSGFRSVSKSYKFVPDDKQYSTYVIKTMCDAQGQFKFTNVTDGSFYAVTSIVWKSGYSDQGGSLMRAVSLRSGTSEHIVLSP